MNIVILCSSFAAGNQNGYAAMFSGLVRELKNRNHQVIILKRVLPPLNADTNQPDSEFSETKCYTSVQDLHKRYTRLVREADMVLVGSSVPEGVLVGEWVTKTATGIKAFYDTDTPGTLEKIEEGTYEYLQPDLIARYDLYLSSCGGPMLELLEHKYNSRMARPFYSFIDPELYYPEQQEIKWDLGALIVPESGRSSSLKIQLSDIARAWSAGRFVVAGLEDQAGIPLPENALYIQQLSTEDHRFFYNSLRFALNISDINKTSPGYSPSLELLRAIACCTPVITNNWDGLGSFFDAGTEILVSDRAGDTLRYLREICNSERKLIGLRARKKVLACHTTVKRAEELESYAHELMSVAGTEENAEVLVPV